MRDLMEEWAQLASRPAPVRASAARMRPRGRLLSTGRFWSISTIHRKGDHAPSACGAVCRLHVETPAETPGCCKKTLALSVGMPEEKARTHLKRWLLHGALMTIRDSGTPRSAHRDIDAREDPRCKNGLEGAALDARLLEVEGELRDLSLL